MTTLTLLDLIAMPPDTSVLFMVKDFAGSAYYGHWHAACAADSVARYGIRADEAILPYRPGLSDYATPQCCVHREGVDHG